MVRTIYCYLKSHSYYHKGITLSVSLFIHKVITGEISVQFSCLKNALTKSIPLAVYKCIGSNNFVK